MNGGKRRLRGGKTNRRWIKNKGKRGGQRDRGEKGRKRDGTGVERGK